MKLPRHSEIWLKPYLESRARRLLADRSSSPRYIWLTVADHFEPYWHHADVATARSRVSAWRKRWPEIASSLTPDYDDSKACYTFFYPVEQYDPEILDVLAELTRDGIADVEVHIHHDGEGRQNFTDRIGTFCETLIRKHGLLRKADGQVRFGFIHGNWALDNSLPGGRWCGLNDEITLLRDLGCYGDFTMPSGASPSQARTINSIYYCIDDRNRPKSYDSGIPVGVGQNVTGDLLIVPGPFGLRWRTRLLPRMETGELAAYDLPTSYRVQRWFDLAPRIGEHAFVKLYSHGAQDSNLRALLDKGLKDLYFLSRAEAERRGAQIRFVSAWTMYRAIEALNRGADPIENDRKPGARLAEECSEHRCSLSERPV